jgi:hypothetical protein
MKISILLLLLSVIARAAPIGICLHSYSPDAPNDKIGSIEFDKIEKDQQGTWVYPANQRAILVTNYRYRGTIAYIDKITPGHPEFKRYLKYYEDNALQIPSTRRFLNPKIIAMRALAAEYEKQKLEYEKLPKIIISGKNYSSPKLIKFEAGHMYISHKDGNTKFDVDSLTEKEIDQLKSIDSSFKNFTIFLIAGSKLWNPKFDGIKEGAIHIRHEKGNMVLPIHKLSDQEQRIITSWSDGTWKIAKSGFSEYSENLGSYKELVLENGNFYTKVTFLSRNKEMINLQTSKGKLSLPVKEIAKINGASEKDQERMKRWVNEIIDDRFSSAESYSESDVISKKILPEGDLVVSDIKVKILQVLEEGFLASGFVGDLHKGFLVVNIQNKKTINHPITNEKVNKIIESKRETQQIVERITDDLCYIVGNTSNLVDGEIVNAKSMRLRGRFQYVDVQGAQRSVRKYHID